MNRNVLLITVLLFGPALILEGCGTKGPTTPIPGKKYACNEAHICPSGGTNDCISDCCGGPPCSGDFYAERPEVPDLAPSADMWGVIGPAMGCKSGMGYQINATSAACPGVFASDPSGQCAPGWSACAANPLSKQACEMRNPFGQQACFIGAVRAADYQYPTSAAMRCTWSGATAQDYRYLLGCGACVGWATTATLCGGFPNTMTCDNPSTGFAYHCPKSVPGKDSDFLQVTNTDPNSGVMCCKM